MGGGVTPLLGPGDADHFRVQVGRYGDRWYADPLPSCPIAEATDDSWPSVTTIKKASGSDWSYVAMKRIADADIRGIEMQFTDERYERLKSINRLGLERAGRRGTNVHKYFERGLRGEPFNDPEWPDEPGSDYLPAVQQFFDTYQPELVAAEVVSINRTLGYGGSPDCFARIDGKVYIIDWKSRGADSKHGAYPEEGAQEAAHAIRTRQPGGVAIGAAADWRRACPDLLRSRISTAGSLSLIKRWPTIATLDFRRHGPFPSSR
jgi:hypothetical protein